MSKTKNLSRIFFIGILVLFFIGFASANGLRLDPNNISVNKTFGIDKKVNFTIFNEEARDFYNIQFKENSIIQMTPIDLSSGQNKTITATIKSNSSYSGIVTLIGYFQQNIGQSNNTYEVNIDYNNGFDVCNLDIISGDSIIWINNVPDEIDLKNTDTNNIIHTILQGENYTRQFTSPTEFNYQATRLTLPFTQTCHINVQSTSGLVHSSNYDFNLDTKISINYEPTNITTNFLTTSYTLNYNDNIDDIFSIKNTGTKDAKNIHLSGNWITFDTNDFDLSPNQQKNIGYTIQPQVFNTNDTNDTYTLNLKIEGNFETKIQNISVFVPYANIVNSFSLGEFDPEFIHNLFTWYCGVKPEDSLCGVIYSNSSGQSTNVTYSSDFIKALFEKVITNTDNFNSLSKNQLELMLNQSQINENQSEILINMSKRLDSLDKKNDDIISVFLFAIGIVCFIFIGVIALYFIFGDRDRIKRILKFHKGELKY